MASRAPRAPRKAPSRGNAAAGAAPDPCAPAGSDMLQAGLKAVAAHNPLFDALLGLDAAHKQRQKELFKWPTFEDLFDQRVERALQRLGISASLEELRAQLAQIDQRLRRLERQLEPPHGRARR